MQVKETMRDVRAKFFSLELPRPQAVAIALIVGITVFRLLLFLAPQRVGDGSEYYGLFLAIHDGHRVYMTDKAWEAYRQLFAQGHILGLVDPDALKATFPSLAQRSGADFNHFWFYSGLAATLAGWLTAFGVSVHTCFLLLHALLLASLAYVSARTFGKAGLLAAAIILLGSPIIWFVDKVHTEFLTFCCISIGTLLFGRQRYFAAALWLALASTQNVSIGATAMGLLALGLWLGRRRGFGFRDVALIGATLALIAVHPIYYFFRIGVIDPQLLAGGARIGANLANTYIWFFDPDIGLVPNWPLSVVILVMAAVAARSIHWRPSRQLLLYLLVFLATNLYAQSSTENLNSGATVNVARYATWYIGLFVPCLAFVLNAVAGARWPVKATAALLLLPYIVLNAWHYRPSRSETYQTPTAFSAWLQGTLPSVYDPPVQIFAERYTGGMPLPASYAVLGPGCRKVLVVEQQGVPVKPLQTGTCNLDPARLPDRLLHPKSLPHTLADGRRQGYLILSDEEITRAQPTFEPGVRYSTVVGQPSMQSFLRDGWSQPEAWGTWSAGTQSTISGRVANCPAGGLRMSVDAIGFVIPKNPKVSVQFSAAGRTLSSMTFDQPGARSFSFDVPCSVLTDGMLNMTLSIHGAASPRALGLSDDDRQLGIGLQNLMLSNR